MSDMYQNSEVTASSKIYNNGWSLEDGEKFWKKNAHTAAEKVIQTTIWLQKKSSEKS